jgi:hypothetical protein
MPSRAATFTLRKSPLRCDLLSSKYGATVKMAGCEWMYVRAYVGENVRIRVQREAVRMYGRRVPK